MSLQQFRRLMTREPSPQEETEEDMPEKAPLRGVPVRNFLVSGIVLLCMAAVLGGLAVLESPRQTRRINSKEHGHTMPASAQLRMLKSECEACKSEYSKTSGVIANPGMLGGAMTYDDVQKALHSSCPEHCTKHKKHGEVSSGIFSGFGGFEDDEDEYGTVAGNEDEEVDADEDDGTPCHTVKRGDMCYDLVIYTVRKLLTNEDFYPGLKKTSTQAQVQARLHQDRPGICSRPCPKGSKDGDTDGPKEDSDKPFDSEGDEDDQDLLEDAIPEASQGCETAMKGDACYDTILWVLKEGVFAHPKWFQGLNQGSSMQEVQLHLHKSPPRGMPVKCPKPCEEDCGETFPGEPCHGGVTWVMEEGIVNHSSWFVGLTPESSFAEVQLNIHNNPNATVFCPKPCNVCHTAIEGERCYSAVMWVLSDGIKKLPDSYPGLTEFSSFEEVQDHLHKNKSENASRCVKPCPVAQESVIETM